MPLPANTAAQSAAHETGSASEVPKPAIAARPLTFSPGAANAKKPTLAGSMQTLKDLAMKSSHAAPNGIADEPLAAAYEKRIQTLQDSLKERDQVVQMLTQRLEQAADQLDRLQRTGGGRGGAVVAGIPPELIENQEAMSEQMTQLVGEWEELQAGDVLARIESRLTDLHELISSGATLSANPSGASVFSDIPAKEPATSGWEAIKAAMMAGKSYHDPASSSFASSATQHVSARASDDIESDIVQRPAPSPLPEPPPAVDLDTADQSQLYGAIRDRDEFIATLLRRLSSPDASTQFPDWEKLNFVPEDLYRELLGLRERLQDKLRVAEVDLSLQRAKLAREDAKLTIKAEQVARQMKQLGFSPDEPGSNISGTRAAVGDGSNANPGRRWLQFLQRPASNGTDEK